MENYKQPNCPIFSVFKFPISLLKLLYYILTKKKKYILLFFFDQVNTFYFCFLLLRVEGCEYFCFLLDV